MASPYTKIPRAIDQIKKFLDYEHSNFSMLSEGLKRREGWAVAYSNPDELYEAVWNIFNNLYDEEGLYPLFIDDNPATDDEVIRRLKAVQGYLQRVETIILQMAEELSTYGFVEGGVYQMWQKSTDAIKLALELAEADLVSFSNSKKAAQGPLMGIIVSTNEEWAALRKMVEILNVIPPNDDDSQIYYEATFSRAGVVKNLVITLLPHMGMQAACVCATKMILSYRPKYLVMVGHLAGNKDVVKLGDIILTEMSLDYHQQIVSEKKAVVEGSERGSEIIQKENSKPIMIETEVKNLFSKYVDNFKLLEEIKSSSPDETSFTDPLKFKIGKVVSGAYLLRSNELFQELKRNNTGLVGLDMETFGVYFAAKNVTSTNKPLFFSIKAVSDFGENSDKLPKTKVAYACYNSARFLKEFTLNEL